MSEPDPIMAAAEREMDDCEAYMDAAFGALRLGDIAGSARWLRIARKHRAIAHALWEKSVALAHRGMER